MKIDYIAEKALFLAWITFTWITFPIHSFLAQKKTKTQKNQKRVLVIPQLSRIGDIVCSTGVFLNIKENYPDSFLAVLVSKKAVGILKWNPRIDEIILIEDYSFLSLIRKIQKSNFDYGINLSATSKNTCLFVWGHITNRIKTIVENPPITEHLTDWMCNFKLLYKNHTYLPAHHVALLKFLGITNPKDKKEIFLSNSAEEKAKEWQKKFTEETKIVGVSITAGNKIKELGDEKFETLINEILKIKDIIVVCIGSKNDRDRIEYLVSKINNPKFTAETNWTLEELPSLIKKLSLYIAVDTGPIYIAHALNVPLIDIVGPCDGLEQPPKDEISLQVLPRNNIKPSSFVFKKRGTKEEIANALKETRVEDILEAVNKLLK